MRGLRVSVALVLFGGLFLGGASWSAPPALAAALSVGATVEVTGTAPIGLRLRRDPGLSGAEITRIQDGIRMTVTGGPVARDGHTWWRLSGAAGGGWAAGDWLRAVAASPAPPQPSPAPSQPRPDPQLLAQVQRVREAFQQLNLQVAQHPQLGPNDKAALLNGDLPRAGQAIQAAESAARRGDAAGVQGALAEAQRWLAEAGQRVAQMAERGAQGQQQLTQVRQVRGQWQQLNTQVSQAGDLAPGDRATLIGDLQRGDQALQAAEGAVQRGDLSAAQGQLAEAQRILSSVSPRMSQLTAQRSALTQQLAAQVQPVRTAVEQLRAQAAQMPNVRPEDRAALNGDLQRADQALQAAQGDAQRGDQLGVRARLGEAQQALASVGQRLKQVATATPPRPPSPVPASKPVVTGINPSPVPALDELQTLTLRGSGFGSGARVLLRAGSEPYVIPPEQTAILNSSEIQVRVNVTRQSAAWTAEIVNLDGGMSNRVGFAVSAVQAPAPSLAPSPVERVLLSQYPLLSQRDPANYRDRAFAEKLDTVPESTRQVPVKDLACAATVYVMLARGGGAGAKIEDFYQIGPGAFRPSSVGADQPFDPGAVVEALRRQRPVVLHGYGGPLREHFVLAVGFDREGSRTTILALDPWPGSGATGPGKRVRLDGTTGRHPDLDVTFRSMRLVTAATTVRGEPTSSPTFSPSPEPQVLAQVERLRDSWRQLGAQISQATQLGPTDRVALSGELQRGGQALQAAESAAQRGDGPVVQNQLAAAQRALSAVSQRLSQLIGQGGMLTQQLVAQVQHGREAWQQLSNQVSQMPQLKPGDRVAIGQEIQRGADALRAAESAARSGDQTSTSARLTEAQQALARARGLVNQAVAQSPGTSPGPVPPPGTQFPAGSVVEVVNTQGLGLRVHQEPAVSAPFTVRVPDGTRLTVIGGPVSRDQYTWWRVSWSAGSTGWAAGEWLRQVAAGPSPLPGGRLIAAVQEVRQAWHDLSTRVNQAPVGPDSRAAVLQDLQRGAQSLSAAEAAAQRGDEPTVQARLADATQILGGVSNRLAQSAQVKPQGSGSAGCAGGVPVGGPAHPSNPFEPGERGYSIWYATERWLKAGHPRLPSPSRDQAAWVSEAPKNGYWVDKGAPVVGSLMLTRGLDEAGRTHIAYVEAVDAGGRQFTVTGMNFGKSVAPGGGKTECFNQVTKRSFSTGQVQGLLGFIYPEKEGDAKFVEVVARVYREMLHQEPDPNSRRLYVGMLKQGRSEAEVRSAVAASPHYKKAKSLEWPVILAVGGVDIREAMSPGDLPDMFRQWREPTYLGDCLREYFVGQRDLAVRVMSWTAWEWADRDPARTTEAARALKESILQWSRATRERGVDFHIIAHSWGGVLTYVALEDIEKGGEAGQVRIDTLVTLGSPVGYLPALSGQLCLETGGLNPARKAICQFTREHVGKPLRNPGRMIGRWINVVSESDWFAAKIANPPTIYWPMGDVGGSQDNHSQYYDWKYQNEKSQTVAQVRLAAIRNLARLAGELRLARYGVSPQAGGNR